jgi:hypothetical protein
MKYSPITTARHEVHGALESTDLQQVEWMSAPTFSVSRSLP